MQKRDHMLSEMQSQMQKLMMKIRQQDELIQELSNAKRVEVSQDCQQLAERCIRHLHQAGWVRVCRMYQQWQWITWKIRLGNWQFKWPLCKTCCWNELVLIMVRLRVVPIRVHPKIVQTMVLHHNLRQRLQDGDDMLGVVVDLLLDLLGVHLTMMVDQIPQIPMKILTVGRKDWWG